MTKDVFDRLDIAFECRRPDPLACYGRLTSYEQPERCLRCPVASWNAALVFSGTCTNEGLSLEEAESNALESVDQTASIRESTLGVKAA